MNTFYSIWGVKKPNEAMAKINEQRLAADIKEPSNLEEQAISLVGTDIYQILIKGYTEKQWGRDCKDLPASIIKRLPVRLTFDNNYFNDRWQGIPIEGYTTIIERLLDGNEIRINTDFLKLREQLSTLTKKILFTGPIDSYFDYCCGPLGYRSLRFETEIQNTSNYQGVAVVNYTEREIPYTRIIEHKHFLKSHQQSKELTVISREYPEEWDISKEPYYPINDEINTGNYARYAMLSQNNPNILFGGRLGSYRYFDMDKVIESAFELARKEGLIDPDIL